MNEDNAVFEVEWLRQGIQRLRQALQRIRNEEGRVCEDFELCRHPACRSSYAAWAIADAALRGKVLS